MIRYFHLTISLIIDPFLFTGRTGTIYGGNKVDEYSRKNDAINTFHDLFLDKTGNQWTERGNFQKLPNKHYPLEIDYGQHGDSGRNCFNVLI